MGRRRSKLGDFDQQRHLSFLRSRAQARFRNEDWQLTEEDYFAAWQDPAIWAQRGRGGTALVLARKNRLKAWHPNNIHIVVRGLLIAEVNHAKLGRRYGHYKKRT
jgi:hypothetical protein